MSHITINSEQYWGVSEAAVTYGLDAHDLEYFCKNGLMQARRIGGRWYIADSALRQYAQGKEMDEPEIDEAEVKKIRASELNNHVDAQAHAEPDTVSVRSSVLKKTLRRKLPSSGRSGAWRMAAAVLLLAITIGSVTVRPETYATKLSAARAATAAVGTLSHSVVTWIFKLLSVLGMNY